MLESLYRAAVCRDMVKIFTAAFERPPPSAGHSLRETGSPLSGSDGTRRTSSPSAFLSKLKGDLQSLRTALEDPSCDFTVVKDLLAGVKMTFVKFGEETAEDFIGDVMKAERTMKELEAQEAAEENKIPQEDQVETENTMEGIRAKKSEVNKTLGKEWGLDLASRGSLLTAGDKFTGSASEDLQSGCVFHKSLLPGVARFSPFGQVPENTTLVNFLGHSLSHLAENLAEIQLRGATQMSTSISEDFNNLTDVLRSYIETYNQFSAFGRANASRLEGSGHTIHGEKATWRARQLGYSGSEIPATNGSLPELSSAA